MIFVPKSEWLVNSPDLNPIENLWAIMENKIYEHGYFNSVEQLTEKIKQVWSEMSKVTLQGLSRSMEKRLESVQKHPNRKANY